MINIEERIKTIESLLSDGSQEHITYAALECRLTIESVCYERFRISYPYLSIKDLNDWRPKQIVYQVCEDISEMVNDEFVLSISKIDSSHRPETLEDFEKLNYHALGTQKSLDLKKLHVLWNSLSGLALHIDKKCIFDNELSIYGDVNKIKCKIYEVLEILKSLKEQTLLACGVFDDIVDFQCVSCESRIKKPASFIKEGSKVISCINPTCSESYLVESNENGYTFTRNVFQFECEGCNGILDIPHQDFQNLKLNNIMKIKCGGCGSLTSVIMRPLVKCENTSKN